MSGYGTGGGQPRRGGRGGRLFIALAVALFSIATYYMSTRQEVNPVTGENQRLALSVDQEIALGLQSAPEMARQHGGLSQDANARALVQRVGSSVLQNSSARNTPYEFKFHLLADPQMINAFALPGGQIFITEGLLKRLKTEDQLAGVLGHEIGHVVGRHSAEQMAKTKLSNGLSMAAVIAVADDQGGAGAQQAAMVINRLVNTRWGRGDELESDRLGVRFMLESGRNPEAMIQVMQILEEAGRGQARPPEFFNTHPNPENRIAEIKRAIEEQRSRAKQ